jgi:hypothetical protein
MYSCVQMESRISKYKLNGRLFFKHEEERPLFPNIVPTIFKFELEGIDTNNHLFFLISQRMFMNVSYLTQVHDSVSAGLFYFNYYSIFIFIVIYVSFICDFCYCVFFIRFVLFYFISASKLCLFDFFVFLFILFYYYYFVNTLFFSLNLFLIFHFLQRCAWFVFD